MNNAKEIFKQWLTEKERIEREAKANGTWKDSGFDSNNHLFKDLDTKVKEKLKSLSQKD